MLEQSLGDRARALATGRARELLIAAGVPEAVLRNKHGPCPVGHPGAANKKPFRFDDKGGRGTWYCTHCGAGDMFSLMMAVKGWSFAEAARFVIDHYGDGRTLPPVQIKSGADEELTDAEISARRARYRELWERGRVIEPGSVPWMYLTDRVPGLTRVPRMLRHVPDLEYRLPAEPGKRYGKVIGRFDAMIAAVLGPDDRVCNIHRTYLTPDGAKLALVDADGDELPVRKKMPAIGIRGGAVRFVEGEHARLGIAEGIETALAAYVIAGIPTWSVLDTNGMEAFVIPQWVTKLEVFVDNDQPCLVGGKMVRPGWKAAKTLLERADVQQRIKERTLRCQLRAPARAGDDMADLLKGMAALKQA